MFSNFGIYRNDEILDKYKVIYDEILILDECGLINSSTTVAFIDVDSNKPDTFLETNNLSISANLNKYNGKGEQIRVLFDCYKLTQSGQYLYKLINKDSSKEFMMDILNLLAKLNKDITLSLHNI